MDLSVVMTGMRRSRIFAQLACVGAIGLAMTLAPCGACAQPTFGRPKHERPPVDPDADRPPVDSPDGPTPTRLPPEIDWLASDPARKSPNMPGFEPQPGAVYCWKTEDGTRYSWSLPFDFKRGEGYDIIVILHPARHDFRWGFQNYPRKPAAESGFRPGDIVICIDGLNGEARRPNQRLFDRSESNLVRFRDTMLEFSRLFPSRRLYLFGAGGPCAQSAFGGSGGGSGGEFAVAFAAAFPALSDGVLVHGAELPDDLAYKSSIPTVLMHGSKDSIVPIAAAHSALAAFKEAGHERVRLRTLRGFNDFTNPVRASECLDYLIGVSAAEPEVVIAAAERLLTPKPADEYSFSCPPWFAGANEVLSRLTESEGPRAVADAPETTRLRAQQLQEAIDAEAARHVEALRPLVATDRADLLALDGGPWLGYLVAFRDDFRSIPSAEQYTATLGLDTVLAAHATTAADLRQAWNQRDTEGHDHAKETFEQLTEALLHCFLDESLPVNLAPWTRAAIRQAETLGIEPDLAERAEYVTLYDKSWRSGLTEYQNHWRAWTLPPASPKPAPAQPAE